ncbi:MAG: hypothetical protein ACR2NO_01070, partial [Chloroflexota bacterium]
VRLLRSREERARWAALAADYRERGAALRRISAGTPAGDVGRRAWMICTMPTVWGIKLEGVVSLAAREAGYRPEVVELAEDTWVRRYHALFGNRNVQTFVPRRHAGSPTLGDLPPEIASFLESRPRTPELLALTHANVDVGRIALSNVLYRNKFSRFDITDSDTLAGLRVELAGIVERVRAAEELVAQRRPHIAFMLEKGLSPAAELFGVCVAGGVPVVQYVNTQSLNGFAFKRYRWGTRHQHPFSLAAETWKSVRRTTWSAEDEESLMRTLSESYVSGTWFDRKRLHQDKRIKPVEEVRRQLELDPEKKTVVVFSHVLWDATFFYGTSLFDDYETWLTQTIRAACANPRVNWVVKLHPDLVWKLKQEGYRGELRDLVAMRAAVGALPDHVKVVLPDTDISTYTFFSLTDVCLTVRGTIGIEMACHGVPVLTAGTGRYSGLGFTIDSGTRDEYLARLASIEDTLPLTDAQIHLARRYAHALFVLRPWQMRSFELIKRRVAESSGHPLETNLVPRVQSASELAGAADLRSLTAWIASDEADYFEAAPKPS